MNRLSAPVAQTSWPTLAVSLLAGLHGADCQVGGSALTVPEASVLPLAQLGSGLVPTESEYALWAEFELYALRDPELREQLRQEGRQQFALLVELVRHHLDELGVVDPPLAPEHLARLFMAVFDSLSRQRVMEPEAVPDDLFATLTNFINDAIQGSASRTARSRARKAR